MNISKSPSIASALMFCSLTFLGTQIAGAYANTQEAWVAKAHEASCSADQKSKILGIIGAIQAQSQAIQSKVEIWPKDRSLTELDPNKLSLNCATQSKESWVNSTPKWADARFSPKENVTITFYPIFWKVSFCDQVSTITHELTHTLLKEEADHSISADMNIGNARTTDLAYQMEESGMNLCQEVTKP